MKRSASFWRSHKSAGCTIFVMALFSFLSWHCLNCQVAPDQYVSLLEIRLGFVSNVVCDQRHVHLWEDVKGQALSDKDSLSVSYGIAVVVRWLTTATKCTQTDKHPLFMKPRVVKLNGEGSCCISDSINLTCHLWSCSEPLRRPQIWTISHDWTRSGTTATWHVRMFRAWPFSFLFSNQSREIRPMMDFVF